jgi:hypothetical protein
MRDIASYSAADWLTFKPLVQRFKYVRNRAVSGGFVRLGAATRDRFLAEHAGLAGKTIAATIAFNMPWAVELFLRTARLNLIDTAVIVLDNSSSKEARAEIAALCRANGVAYLPLPRNPEWGPNRSHGIALNWAYRNLVRPLDPPVFAFLDHDLFALEPVDLAGLTAGQPVYGAMRRSRVVSGAWSLWAGFCVFDHAALKSRTLDFNYEGPMKLDTGGYNWTRLYRDLDATRMRFAKNARVAFCEPDTQSTYDAAMFDGFVHVGRVSYSGRGREPGRIAFYRRLVAHIEAGGRWQDLTLPVEGGQRLPWAWDETDQPVAGAAGE